MHAFQDDDYCYFVEDYCPGGSMSYLIDHTSNGKLLESEAQFYISCILFALEYIHGKGIVHRTITLDNLLIDYTGYCKLTNFYYACENGKQAASIPNDNPNVNDCYIAPEIKQINNLSSFISDFYSVGVCLYILLTGKIPKSNPKNDLTVVKSSCSTDVNDFLENILVSDQYQRLGCKYEIFFFFSIYIFLCLNSGGIKQILKHPWMKEYTWSNVRKKDQTPAIHIDFTQTRYNTDKAVIPSIISTSKPNLSEIFKDYNFKETVNVSEEQQLSDLIKSSDITAEFYSGGITQA